MKREEKEGKGREKRESQKHKGRKRDKGDKNIIIWVKKGNDFQVL